MVLLCRNSAERTPYRFPNGLGLRPHQEAELAMMEKMEYGHYIVGDKIIHTRFGIAGTCSAGGKTRTLLAVVKRSLQTYQAPWTTLPVHGSGVVTVYTVPQYIEERSEENRMNTTLIIVPNYLVHHWKTEVRQCGLTYHVYQSGQPIFEQDVIILSASRFRQFYSRLGRLWFKRIIVDEAASIQIFGEQYIRSSFIWFVSSNYLTLDYNRLVSTTPLYTRYFQTWSEPWMYTSYVVVESEKNWVNEFILQTHGNSIHHRQLHCYDQLMRCNEDVAGRVNLGMYSQAIRQMGFQSVRMPQPDAPAVAPMQCSVCYEDLDAHQSHVVSKCCKQTYCPHCICHWLSTCLKNSCPMCRHEPVDIVLVGDEDVPAKKEKTQALVDLIKESPIAARFLVLTMWSDGIHLVDTLASRAITSRVLQGRMDFIADQHNAGQFKVLIMDWMNRGDGINLSWVTDFVIMGSVNAHTKQALMRKLVVNRPRGQVLNVHTIVY